jgi:hypothetical protein
MTGDPLFLGMGAAVEKSAPLSSVSAHPAFLRNNAVVFDSAGAFPPSEQPAAPYPTRSTIDDDEQEEIGEVPFTSATFPSEFDMPETPTTSGVGSWAPPPPLPRPVRRSRSKTRHLRPRAGRGQALDVIMLSPRRV